MTLLNCNEMRNAERELPEEQRQMILDFAAEKGSVSRKEVEELIQAGTTKAFRLLRELCTEGKLKAEGSGRLSRYIPL